MLGKWSLERTWGGRGRWRGEAGPGEPLGCRVRWGGEPGLRAGWGGASSHRLSAPHQEERVLSGTLEASKALLEEQLEAAQERCARLHETQRENLLLRTRLGEAHAVRPPVTQ